MAADLAALEMAEMTDATAALIENVSALLIWARRSVAVVAAAAAAAALLGSRARRLAAKL